MTKALNSLIFIIIIFLNNNLCVPRREDDGGCQSEENAPFENLRLLVIISVNSAKSKEAITLFTYLTADYTALRR